MKNLIALVFACISCLCAISAPAADITIPALDIPISLSGFGTIGFAGSDQSYNYQRFVNKDGTFKRDSVMGVQMDARLSSEFSMTLQAKVAPSLSSDKDVDVSLSWAFLSWRPTNDWLIRVGRLRVPLYLNSENMDVGTTFDFARLPAEVYTTAQTTDGDGIFVSKTWNMEVNEVTLVGYVGTTETSYRAYRRDNAPSLSLSYGSYFEQVRVDSSGLVLTLTRGDNIFRMSVHDTYIQSTGNQLMPETYPYVSLRSDLGYYQTSNLMPGPGVPSKKEIHSLVYTLGADVEVGYGFRIMGEYVFRNVLDISTGMDSMAGYLAVLKSFGRWTPYISVARLQTMPRTRDLYNNVNGNRVPEYDATAAQINALQRAGADGILAFDQTTVALGTSYRINPTNKIKMEWARTKTGDMSSFIDAPPGGESGGQVINVFSLSYNVVF
ncbi:MAG: hypothetical protein WCK00_02415 [Deltaproteobacteria bacterium]